MSVAGFKVLLHRREMTINELAREARVGRSHLSQVLNGKPGRGGQTRRKVAPLLTGEELGRLGWDHEGKVISNQSAGVISGNVSTDQRTGGAKKKASSFAGETILDLERE